MYKATAFLGCLLSAFLFCCSSGAKVAQTEEPDVETASERYKHRFRGRTGEWFLWKQENHLLDLLEPWKGASVLDIGGGHGQYTERLVRRGFAVTVLGSSPQADRQIRDLVASGQCQYLVGDFTNIMDANGSFDIVVSFRLLAHMERWRSVVSEAARVARHAVIVDFPVSRSFNSLYPVIFWLKRAYEGSTTRPFHVFREQEVIEEFHKSGFSPTGRLAQYFLPMAVHRALHAPSVSMTIEKICGSVGLTKRWGSPVVLRVEPKPEAYADKPRRSG